MVLAELFWVFVKISLITFGGGYSFLPFIEREVVQGRKWLGEAEFLEATGMAQVFPGALSIKFATYTGYKVAGIGGAVVANLGNLLPTALLMIFALLLYSKYKSVRFVKSGLEMIRYAVFAMIIAVAIQLVDKSNILVPKYIAVIAASFVLFCFTKTHPAFIILGAGILGAALK
ncbi:MAG TPA: chromate transporter [Planctomycetes bacterium]|nr:chromate transporter [Planctomycetota bacterium]HIJ71507.1 chromate transporter [Planctomycetota bacterium]